MSEFSSHQIQSGAAQLGLLGSFSLRIAAQPVPLPMNEQRLVSFVALNDGTLLRHHVAGSLWGATTDQHAGGSLRSALWRLGHLPHPLVDVVGGHLKLSNGVDVDIHASEVQAHRILDDSSELDELDLDESRLSTDLLLDWTEEWVLMRRERFHQLRLRALETLCRKLVAMGRIGQAVQAGIAAVSGEPLRESAHRELVMAHIAEGNVAAALRQYESFRVLLADELKLEPSEEMKLLVKGLNP
jgi:DNA-binding SARP family transcriptional activator